MNSGLITGLVSAADVMTSRLRAIVLWYFHIKCLTRFRRQKGNNSSLRIDSDLSIRKLERMKKEHEFV